MHNETERTRSNPLSVSQMVSQIERITVGGAGHIVPKEYRKRSLKLFVLSLIGIACAIGLSALGTLLAKELSQLVIVLAFGVLLFAVTTFFVSLIGVLIGMPIKEYNEKMKKEPLWKRLVIGTFGGLFVSGIFLGILFGAVLLLIKYAG